MPVILETECFSGENWVYYELIPKKVLPLLPNSLIFSMFCQLLVSSSRQPLLCPGPFSPLCVFYFLSFSPLLYLRLTHHCYSG